nr:hypothetical protein [uncultured bacterium]
MVTHQSGSHKKWHHAAKNATLTVPFHAGKTVPLGTMLAIMKNAKLPYDVWID